MYSKLPGKKIILTNNNLSINAKILDVLRAKTHTYISGEQLSRELNMSRTAVWKHVNALRALGYRVEAITSMGYKLISSPSLLLPLEIKNGLKTEFIGHNIHWEYEVVSTNTLALQLAEKGASEGTVVVSECQKQGRGRMGRTWQSQPEIGIYLSLILRPNFVPMKAPSITFMSAIAVVEALERTLGIQASIKWPNDVLIRRRKTSGILMESSTEGTRIAFAVLGIGINLNVDREIFPEEFRSLATSLSSELGHSVDRIAFTRRLFENLETQLDRHAEGGFDAVRPRFEAFFGCAGSRSESRRWEASESMAWLSPSPRTAHSRSRSRQDHGPVKSSA